MSLVRGFPPRMILLLVVGRVPETLGFEGEYQSMSLAPCAPAPSHPLHAMPPRITRNSDRPRASDRTMVDVSRPVSLAKSQDSMASSRPEDEPRERPNTTNQSHTRRSNRGARNSGLDLQATSCRSGRGRTFFLTSLFIELIDPGACQLPRDGGERTMLALDSAD